MTHMNPPPAIERNRSALAAIVAAIAALIGGREGDGLLARTLRNTALALLRPAEAAARRLIVVVARGLVVTSAATRAPFPGRQVFGPARADAGRVPAFALHDRLKNFSPRVRRLRPGFVPRIRTFFGEMPDSPAAPAPADRNAPVAARPLRLRLRALEAALADLPAQARRLARRRARLAAAGRFIRSPLRPGRPPGWRASEERDIDRVLTDCHALAYAALRPDTS
jgi:hypothetical protein